MKTTRVIVLAVTVSLVCATMASAEIKMGLWEMTTKMEMTGMPAQISIPATTARTCISKDDMVPKPAAQKKGQECKIKDQKVTGDTVTYSMECAGKDGNVTQISGEMKYTGDTLEGSSTIKTQGRGAMEMSNKITGKYIGPCPK
jgi:hypothetical protein